MSRRKNRGAGGTRQNAPSQAFLKITIEMMPTGRIEVDPKYNKQAIENLDRLYAKAEREDYDKNWDDDHKVAFFQYQVFDEILSQYEPPAPPDDDIDPASGVPSLREKPVRDVIDQATMPRARLNLSSMN